MAGDYMMRMIEQIAAMLASMIGKKAAGKVAEAKLELEQSSISLIGLPLSKIKQLSPETVSERLSQSGGLRHLHAVKLAELLLLDAEWNSSDDQKGTLANKVHAFCLLSDSLSALRSDEQSFFRQKLNAIGEDLGELRNHPYIHERLLARKSP